MMSAPNLARSLVMPACRVALRSHAQATPTAVWSRDMSTKKAKLAEALGKFSPVKLVSHRARKEVKMCPAKPPKAPSASLGDYDQHDPQDLTFGEFEEIRKAGNAILIDVRNPGKQ